MEEKNQTPNTEKRNKSNNQGHSGLSDYLKYAGMGFQMLAIIGILTWVGMKLDARSGDSGKIYTAIFALLGVIIGIYTVIKDFINPKDDK